MMKIKCEAFKEIFRKEEFMIMAFRPLENYEMELSQYGSFTIKGELGWIKLKEKYELDLELEEINNYGVTYKLNSLPSLNLENLTDESEYEYLCQITTPKQATYVHEAYPNFIRLVLEGKQEEINVKNIYNVKDSRKNFLVREIEQKFKFFVIKRQFQEYNLSLNECKLLNVEFKSMEDITNALENKPYNTLIELCGRSFESSDAIILKVNPSLIESFQRTEHLILDILDKNEYDANTRINARELAIYAKEIAPECLKNMKEIAIESDLIYYDESKNILSRMDSYMCECEIAYELKTRLSDNVVLNLPYEKYKTIKDGTLTEEQTGFLKMCSENKVGILTAPSGCGKSSAVMALLEMLDDYKMTYTLCTPTGKSSKRLSQQTFRESSTIHRAIGFRSEPREIITDFLIVDEISMVGIDLFCSLLRSTSKDTRIVLIGDVSQIPSISLGNVFKDIIDSKLVPITYLTFCFRFKEGGLSAMATKLRKGKYYLEGDTSKRIVMGKNKDYEFIRCENEVDQILDEYKRLLDDEISIEDICVITPCNVKKLGTVNINNNIQAMINPAKPNENVMTKKWNNILIKFRKGDLILVCKNNYNALTKDGYDTLKKNEDFSIEDEEIEKVAIFNGEIGKILHVSKEAMFVKIDEKTIVFLESDLVNLMLGYSLNVFKMQGSEVPYVISITSNMHSFMLNRNLAYTAVTRARKKVVEIGDEETIRNLIDVSAELDRNTWLCELLKEG